MFGVNGYISRTQNGETGYFMRDAHGDILKAYGEDNTLLADYTYDAWGNGTKEEGSWGQENPIRYAGEYTDSESGMIYLRARYYAPELGRFISEDPIKNGLNWYAYCDSNPVMRVDPSGQSWEGSQLYTQYKIAKWAFDNRQAISDAAKVAQRSFWDLGSKLLLRKKWGYETSAWLLEHSLQDNPENVSRGNDSRIAGLVKQDENFLGELDKQLVQHQGEDSFYSELAITFDTGDLHYSINRCIIKISCTKQEDGSWYIYGYLWDKYDYTEITTMMGDEMGASIGTLANDAAVVSQQAGAIQPYNIEVTFELTR